MPRWGGRWSPSVSDQYPWLLHTLASRSSVKSVSQSVRRSPTLVLLAILTTIRSRSNTICFFVAVCLAVTTFFLSRA